MKLIAGFAVKHAGVADTGAQQRISEKVHSTAQQVTNYVDRKTWHDIDEGATLISAAMQQRGVR